jgi:predicted AlkP superfamily pyrophosphatase or phosphodiesterase
LLFFPGACCVFGSFSIAQDNDFAKGPIKRVLLISVDGMLAMDLSDCVNGIGAVNGGDPYCPALAALSRNGVNYVAARTSKSSDSFPGLVAIVTGGSPALTGIYYDVAYARNLDAPAKTTGNVLAAGPCIQ